MRFTYWTAHCALLLGKGVNKKNNRVIPLGWTSSVHCLLQCSRLLVSQIHGAITHKIEYVDSLFYPDTDVVPVLSTALLKFFMSTRNSSGWPCSNITILSLYVYESESDGFWHILILMIPHLLTLSVSFLMIGIDGVLSGIAHLCSARLVKSSW